MKTRHGWIELFKIVGGVSLVLAIIMALTAWIVEVAQSSSVREGVITERVFRPSWIETDYIKVGDTRVPTHTTHPDEWWVAITGPNKNGKVKTRWLRVSKECYSDTVEGQEFKASEVW